MECPVCKSSTNVRDVLYEMPADEPDSGKYVLGGCCISPDSPDFVCLGCGWEQQSEITHILTRHLPPGGQLFKGKVRD